MTSAALIVNRMLTPRRPISRGVTLGAGSILSGGILLAWCVATYGGLADPLFLPAPHRVIGAFWHSLMDGSLLKNTWASLLVINVGFLLSSLVAVPLGILMGSFRVVAAALEPIVQSGARGAMALAGIATAIVIGIWFAFYFLVFVPRAAP